MSDDAYEAILNRDDVPETVESAEKEYAELAGNQEFMAWLKASNTSHFEEFHAAWTNYIRVLKVQEEDYREWMKARTTTLPQF
jgi:hypothetical protein